jgi:SAM-dependent methyltransferase
MTSDSGFQIAPTGPHFYEIHVARFMAPFVEALVAATVRAGDAVLDVACGTGFATRAAAEAAGSGARVEGTDLNPAMVNHARSIPESSGAVLGWSEASALDLPYGDGEFDAVICQQGLQFFPDPTAAIIELSRVTRAGGRLGVTVWSPPEDSPFLLRETEMLARHGGGPTATFSATEDQLRAWFVAAGLGSPAIELLVVDVDLPAILEYVPEHLKALPWSAGFFTRPEETQAAALAELDEHLASYRTDDGIRIPFSSYLVTTTL